MSGEYVMIIVLSVLIAITTIIAIVMTSIYASKSGEHARLTNEKKYLDVLAGSSSCECKKPA